jgi:hypothetical protein
LRPWNDNVTALGALLRLIPLVAAALLLTAQPLDWRVAAGADAVVTGIEREAPQRSAGDFVTRRHRHAASVEEFFAIDDDADQFSASAEHVIVPAPTSAIRFAVYQAATHFGEIPPSHRPCAGSQTGPPTA